MIMASENFYNILNKSKQYLVHLNTFLGTQINIFTKSLKMSKTMKLNLVLDLDETLIKCVIPYSTQNLIDMRLETYYLCDFEFENVIYCIFYRPYLFQCLDKWSNLFNIYIHIQYKNIAIKSSRIFMQMFHHLK